MNKSIVEIIKFLEINLNEFGKEIDTTNARKLIRSDFKISIDSKIFYKN